MKQNRKIGLFLALILLVSILQTAIVFAQNVPTGAKNESASQETPKETAKAKSPDKLKDALKKALTRQYGKITELRTKISGGELRRTLKETLLVVIDDYLDSIDSFIKRVDAATTIDELKTLKKEVSDRRVEFRADVQETFRMSKKARQEECTEDKARLFGFMKDMRDLNERREGIIRDGERVGYGQNPPWASKPIGGKFLGCNVFSTADWYAGPGGKPGEVMQDKLPASLEGYDGIIFFNVARAYEIVNRTLVLSNISYTVPLPSDVPFVVYITSDPFGGRLSSDPGSYEWLHLKFTGDNPLLKVFITTRKGGNIFTVLRGLPIGTNIFDLFGYGGLGRFITIEGVPGSVVGERTLTGIEIIDPDAKFRVDATPSKIDGKTIGSTTQLTAFYDEDEAEPIEEEAGLIAEIKVPAQDVTWVLAGAKKDSKSGITMERGVSPEMDAAYDELRKSIKVDDTGKVTVVRKVDLETVVIRATYRLQKVYVYIPTK